MIAWESLLTGFGFRFRSLVNLLASAYLMSSALAYFGFGESGFMNLANAARHLQLITLGDWIQNFYQSSRSCIPERPLMIVFFIWLVLICLLFVSKYKDGSPSNLTPNAAIAAASIWALWVDFISPETIWNCPLIAIIVSLLVIAWKVDHVHRDGVATAFLALIGILVCFVYVVLAPPLWFAGSDYVNQIGAFERGFNAGRSVTSRN